MLHFILFKDILKLYENKSQIKLLAKSKTVITQTKPLAEAKPIC
jgi:hypothetical protein